jgi:hypothetical protein
MIAAYRSMPNCSAVEVLAVNPFAPRRKPRGGGDSAKYAAKRCCHADYGNVTFFDDGG